MAFLVLLQAYADALLASGGELGAERRPGTARGRRTRCLASAWPAA